MPVCPGGESGRSRYLLGVGPVPVDGVAVGHHLGSRVLAVHTHPDEEVEDEEERVHLRHSCTGSPDGRLQSLLVLGDRFWGTWR